MYSFKEYNLVGFEKARAANKKYAAILQNKLTGRLYRVSFGDIRYQHYKDSTGKNLYEHLNHHDKKRRMAYKARHSGFIKKGFYTPAYLSLKYLW